MTISEIYISTDVEADGPIPGPHSMLSFASAAYLSDKTLVGTFSANLELLPNAIGDPKTMEWWKQNPVAWQTCRIDCAQPAKAMKDYTQWLSTLPGVPIFVGYPASYDFMFVYWYLMQFVGISPFGHAALDIRSFAMAVLKKNYTDSSKRHFPENWFDPLPHTHVALDDAKAQGALFCNMLIANSKVNPQIRPVDDKENS
jgi:hypothetical protein